MPAIIEQHIELHYSVNSTVDYDRVEVEDAVYDPNLSS